MHFNNNNINNDGIYTYHCCIKHELEMRGKLMGSRKKYEYTLLSIVYATMVVAMIIIIIIMSYLYSFTENM